MYAIRILPCDCGAGKVDRHTHPNGAWVGERDDKNVKVPSGVSRWLSAKLYETRAEAESVLLWLVAEHPQAIGRLAVRNVRSYMRSKETLCR